MVEKGDFQMIMGEHTREVYGGVMKALTLEKQLKLAKNICDNPVDEVKKIMRQGTFMRKYPDVQATTTLEMIRCWKRCALELNTLAESITKDIVPTLEKV